MFRLPANFQNLKNPAKRIFALFVTSAIAATGLISAVAIPASAAPVTKFDWVSISRVNVNNEFTLRPNETLSVRLSSNVDPFIGDGTGTTQLSSNLAVTPGISGVAYGSKYYNWSISGTVSGSSCSQSLMTATVTPCASATRVNYSVSQSLTNNTSSPKTITTNMATAQLTYGTTVLTATTNASADRSIYQSSPEMNSGVIISSDDRFLNGSITLCLDSTRVAVGDVLTWQKSATINGTVISDSYHVSNPYITVERNGSALANLTLTAPLPTQIMVNVSGGNLGSSPGTLAISVDLQKAGVSVLTACPSQGGGGGGYTPPPPLFSLGGASVSGTFSANSVITATPNSWSRTAGGAAITTTNSYDWVVCTMAQTTSTTSPADVPCIGMNGNYQFVLTDGTVGSLEGSSSEPYSGATLTLTQNLLTALSGKYLMIVVSGQATSPTARSNVFMQTCGPISAGTPCSVSFGSAPPSLAAQTPPGSVPASVKAKKKITIPATAASGLAVRVTATGGCKVAAVVKTVKTKVGKKTVTTKLTTGYTVTMGKKGTTCTITRSNAGNATYAALNSVTTVAVS